MCVHTSVHRRTDAHVHPRVRARTHAHTQRVSISVSDEWHGGDRLVVSFDRLLEGGHSKEKTPQLTRSHSMKYPGRHTLDRGRAHFLTSKRREETYLPPTAVRIR